MIRPNLLHPRGESRHARRHRRSARRSQRSEDARETQPRIDDPAVRRVREAGGPVDRASYTCECGYLFSAAVSTSVSCPHCGSGQAW